MVCLEAEGWMDHLERLWWKREERVGKNKVLLSWMREQLEKKSGASSTGYSEWWQVADPFTATKGKEKQNTDNEAG